MAQHNQTGNLGEELALQFLANKGCQIICKNYRFGKTEVDIICRDGRFVVFVEVKTRHANFLVEPELAVTRAKQRSIIRAADHYMVVNNLEDEARFDIVSVVVFPDKNLIEHIDGAFSPIVR